MYCLNCGTEIPSSANFCPSCGHRVSKNDSRIKITPLVCESCHGTMDMDFDNGIATCPHCGRIALIDEDPQVKVERYRMNAKLNGQQTHRDVECERLLYKREKEMREEYKLDVLAFKGKLQSKVIITSAVLFLLVGITDISDHILGSILMLLSSSSLVFSWLIGVGTVKPRAGHSSYMPIALLGFLLFILSLRFF